MIEVEEKYMARCIELAKGGRGNVSPNPMVGAVVVHKGRIIGEGFHRKCGEAHAEVNAIASVKDESLLKDSTIYVSLEPCSHYGEDASLRRVDYPERDSTGGGRLLGSFSRGVGARRADVA